MKVQICTVDKGMFVHEVRGVNYVTWVSHENRREAMLFPGDKASEWLSIIEGMAKVECTIKDIPRPGML